jgi:hypothetical protein
MLQSSAEAIFYCAMVLPVRTIPHFLFCEYHMLNLLVLQTSHIAQSPLSSKFLIFFLPSLLQSCLPAFLSFLVSVQLLFIVGDVVELSLHLDEFGLSAHHYRIVCMYGHHGTAVSVHPVYSTVCTMVGVAPLQYQVHVHAA